MFKTIKVSVCENKLMQVGVKKILLHVRRVLASCGGKDDWSRDDSNPGATLYNPLLLRYDFLHAVTSVNCICRTFKLVFQTS